MPEEPLSHMSSDYLAWFERAFSDQVALIREGRCPLCSEVVDLELLKGVDLIEYEISGICYSCQQNYFEFEEGADA